MHKLKVFIIYSTFLFLFVTTISAAAQPLASAPAAALPAAPVALEREISSQTDTISAVGSWNEARTPNGSIPVCMEYSPNFTQVRYGVGLSANRSLPTEAQICATSPFLEKSGLEFVGFSDVEIVCDSQFKIGEFSHHNNPIYYINNYDDDILRTARLDIAVSGDANVNLPVFINFEETPNAGPCPYGGNSNGCYDRVTYSVTPQTLVLNGQTCELTIEGFGDCNAPTGSVTSGEFITLEGGVANRTCLWASTSAIIETEPTSPPPITCPVGYTQIDTIQGDVFGSTVLVHNYNVTDPSDILLQGYAKEGFPELGCTVSGAGDLNPQCYTYQNSENFDVYINSSLGRTNIGQYRDNQGAGNLQNYYFYVGPYQINVDSGPFTVELQHPGPLTWHGVGYKMAVCSKVTGFTTNRDYGDAPSPYPSASAIATVNLTIGTEAVDSENGMIRDANALGDDNYGSDDENGVFFHSGGPHGNSNQLKSVDVTVVNNAVPNAYLYGWLDYNRNGSFDGSEQIINGDVFPQSATPATRIYSFTIPGNIGCGTAVARFRLNDSPLNAAAGDGNKGEIEDYVFNLCDNQKDFGDAPVSYGSAPHVWVPGIRLGAIVDKEVGPFHSTAADGDDNNNADDEDGIEFIDGLIFEQGVTGYRVRSTVLNQWDAGQHLRAWIDFDKDGQFSNVQERIFTQPVTNPNLNNQVFVNSFDIPPDAECGITYMRIRLGSGTLTPTSVENGGEAEDYQVEINCTDPTQEPPVYCPAGAGQLSLVSGEVAGIGDRDTYNFDMSFDGPFFVVGYVKEGNPDLGCSLTGTDPGDAAICSQYENDENLDVIQSSGGTETTLGSYLDQQGTNGWQNFFLEVGPYTSLFAPTGPNQLIVEGRGSGSAGYKFAICEGDPGIPPTIDQDLGITVDGPAQTGPTDSFNWTITVRNLSTVEDGENVRFTSTFPPAVTVSGLSLSRPADWTCTTALGNITCVANNTLPPGYSSTFLAVANVPAVFTATEIRNVATLTSNPADPVANQFNNIDEAVTSVVQADLAIDIQADKDPIMLEETMTWSVFVSNNNSNPAFQNSATNPEVTVDLPAGVDYTNHSTFNGWSCTPAGSQATCTKSSLGYGTADQKVIELYVRIPGTYTQNTVTAAAEIDADTYDPVSSNNSDSVTSDVDRTWTVPEGLENLISPYTHIRYAASLNTTGNDLDREWDFDTDEYIENLLQIPVDGAFAISASGKPTLTVKYCTTPGNTGQCSSPDAIIVGEMIIKSVTYDTLIYQQETSGGALVDNGPNLIGTPISVDLGIDANPSFRTGRYIVDSVAACQAIGDPTLLESAVDCLMPYDDTRATVAEPNPTLYERIFEWQPYEYLAIVSETKGGRAVTPPAGRAEVVLVSGAKPGLFRLSGDIFITVEFIDSRLGPNPVTFDLPAFPVSAYFQLVAPFTEPDS